MIWKTLEKGACQWRGGLAVKGYYVRAQNGWMGGRRRNIILLILNIFLELIKIVCMKAVQKSNS